MSAENYRLGTPSETVYEVPNTPGGDGKVEIELRHLAVPVGGGESVADPSRTVTFKANPGAKLTIRKVENQVVEVPSERRWLITFTTEMRLLTKRGEYEWFWVEQPYTTVKMPSVIGDPVISKALEKGQQVYEQYRLAELWDSDASRQLYEQVRIAEWNEQQAKRRLEYEKAQADLNYQRTKEAADYNLSVDRAMAEAELANTRAIADAKARFDEAMAQWTLESVQQDADARLEYDQKVADIHFLKQQVLDLYEANYERYKADAIYEATLQNASRDAQFEQAYAYANAHNAEAAETTLIAGLYNAVASGQILTQEQQQALAQYVSTKPELFSPQNGLLSSEQLSRAFTDPSVLQSTVTVGGQPLAFMPAQPDGSPTTPELSSIDLSNPQSMSDFSKLMTALNPATPQTAISSTDFSAESIKDLTPKQMTDRYSFVCTCSDYTGKVYNPSTGETRSWTSSAVPTLYGQRVCKHILAAWNQLGVVSAADIPKDVPDV